MVGGLSEGQPACSPLVPLSATTAALLAINIAMPAELQPQNYPKEAFTPNGILWWRAETEPGKKRLLGAEPKITAYLRFHVGKNGTFTIRQLRQALGTEAVPEDAEHLNRRMRELRVRDGWVINSQKDEAALDHDQYRVVKIGWYLGSGTTRPKSDAPSDMVRRRMFERDNHTCVICGIPAGEPYPDLPTKTARMTWGHRVPGKRLGRDATLDDVQTECARCNETARDELFNPVTLPEVLPTIRNLPRKDKVLLLRWLREGRRPANPLDQAYANARRLSAQERSDLLGLLTTMAEQ
jgi:5-methylcytosine-specific restriction endonuclease McrA